MRELTSESVQPQRKQITVAFIDLAGSTELSSRLDPEDFRNLILVYQGSVGTVVESHHGFIARFLGDGILVYFGYPKAHENDAALAVHAGLEVIEAVAALDVDQYQISDGLGVRIGIMTGPAVVGDIIGKGASQESTALGEMPNIAARLQSEAKPNQLVIGDTTKNIVAGLFEFEDLGTPELKGVGRSVGAFRVTGVTEATSRFDRSLHLGLSELVGRRRELEELEQAWELAVNRVQSVGVIADAGIGKSRLVHEFTERLGRDQAFFLLGHCSIGGVTSPLHPFIELVRTAFQIRDSSEFPDSTARLHPGSISCNNRIWFSRNPESPAFASSTRWCATRFIRTCCARIGKACICDWRRASKKVLPIDWKKSSTSSPITMRTPMK